ncbi:hypothetical protein [Pseudofrankia sp. BMG5.36]|uniref:hypothetical protein n=1 Tax=Pseudofrankia sp. BMG5.36 TaxID=1834512 RepID=UPI0008D9C783|nr:hypothetical protein [Pseudofrankia sp. BMG5.36]OHV56495.1 hypothetical protein BCD48_08515 [Pseudofrankia sp. BMG5.36]
MSQDEQDEKVTVEFTVHVTASIGRWSIMLGTEPTSDAVARSITAYYLSNIKTADHYVPADSETAGRVLDIRR